MWLKMKNRSHKCDIKRPRSRHGQKYTKHEIFLTFEAQFMKKLSNVEAELEKRVAYKKSLCQFPFIRSTNVTYLRIVIHTFFQYKLFLVHIFSLKVYIF